jgi:hypothetical protein
VVPSAAGAAAAAQDTHNVVLVTGEPGLFRPTKSKIWSQVSFLCATKYVFGPKHSSASGCTHRPFSPPTALAVLTHPADWSAADRFEGGSGAQPDTRCALQAPLCDVSDSAQGLILLFVLIFYYYSCIFLYYFIL